MSNALDVNIFSLSFSDFSSFHQFRMVKANKKEKKTLKVKLLANSIKMRLPMFFFKFSFAFFHIYFLEEKTYFYSSKTACNEIEYLEKGTKATTKVVWCEKSL